MSSEKELLDQIEELKKKAKDMEKQNKDTEFNKQRKFLINKVRDFIGIQVSDAEVLAILARFYLNDRSKNRQDFQYVPIKYYVKEQDKNILFERKVLNRYANIHTIRYEDSVDIISDFLGKIKPINPTPEMLGQIKRDGHGNFGYIPLFC
jgi:hypothetical protein